MNSYLITYICGDTYNIPTYDFIHCEEKDLVPILDRHSDYFGWRTSKKVNIYELGKDVNKWELIEKYDSLHRTKIGEKDNE